MAVGIVFLAVRKRSQKETVAELPQTVSVVLLPAWGCRPQKEKDSTETPASKWSHLTAKCPMTGGKCPLFLPL